VLKLILERHAPSSPPDSELVVVCDAGAIAQPAIAVAATVSDAASNTRKR
jgi:hypothetical protein